MRRFGWHCFDCWLRDFDTRLAVHESDPIRLIPSGDSYVEDK